MFDMVIERDPLRREAILEFQDVMQQMVQAQPTLAPDLPLSHVFAPGAYARTIFIPADTVVVGKIHKHAHLNMLMQGRVSLMTEEGPTVLQAPQVLCSKAGTKRVVYAQTDTIWTTVHLTEQTDLELIEDEIIAKTYEEFEAFQITQTVSGVPDSRQGADL